MAGAFHGVGVTRVRDGVRTDDRELAAGFLLSEGVLKTADDLGTIEYCTDPAAVDLAEECGITLIGFLRGRNFNTRIPSV